ncbi:MAG TPA: hypothetical protein PLG25_04015 [bacterium]|nr:hypothetical protein [bacterium]
MRPCKSTVFVYVKRRHSMDFQIVRDQRMIVNIYTNYDYVGFFCNFIYNRLHQAAGRAVRRVKIN